MDSIVSLKSMGKVFHTKNGDVKALDDINLDIKKGEIFGIIGLSGAGKSTLVRCINYLEIPTEGDVFFEGKGLKTMTEAQIRDVRRNMGMIFQQFNLLSQRNILKNVCFPLEISGVGKAEAIKRARELLKLVGLSDREKAYPAQLSGGQRQRVGIARALVVNPDFIVADEPVSALDVSIQAQVVNMFEDLQKERGLTYLFIAHDLSIVNHISNRIGVMYLGKMVELAAGGEIIFRPLHPYTKSLISAIPVADPKVSRERSRIVLEGEVPSPLNPPSGCHFRTRCQYATEQCAMEVPKWREMEKGHFVACHNIEKIN